MRCMFLLACERAAYGTRGSRLSALPVDVLAMVMGRLLPRRQRKRNRDKAAMMFTDTRSLREELRVRAHRKTMAVERTRCVLDLSESVHG